MRTGRHNGPYVRPWLCSLELVILAGWECMYYPHIFLDLGADLFDEYRVDDPETVDQILDLLGKLFLAMLAKLERLDLLKPDSEVKNLAAVMIMFIGNSQELSHYELRFPESFATNVLAYAIKHGIALSELFKVDEFVKDHSEEAGGVSLPAADSNSNDP